MSEQEDQTQIELDTLKERATTLGINFHPSIGEEKLRAKIQAKINGAPEVDVEVPKDKATVVKPTPAKAPDPLNIKGTKETKPQRAARKRKEAMRLIRIRVANMNPRTQHKGGDLFSAGNTLTGNITKYVPYNNDEGWHVPQIIVNYMREKQCQSFTTVQGPRGNKIRKGKLIREFAIEILPPLTKEDMKELARKQAMASKND